MRRSYSRRDLATRPSSRRYHAARGAASDERPRHPALRREAIMHDLDLTAGVPAESIADGQVVAGRVGDQDVLLVHAGGEFYAVRAQCTHYRGSLADGIVVGSTIRCPLHHACFDLATGDALCAPALDPLPCWRAGRRGARFRGGAPFRAPP